MYIYVYICIYMVYGILAYNDSSSKIFFLI